MTSNQMCRNLQRERNKKDEHNLQIPKIYTIYELYLCNLFKTKTSD